MHLRDARDLFELTGPESLARAGPQRGQEIFAVPILVAPSSSPLSHRLAYWFLHEGPTAQNDVEFRCLAWARACACVRCACGLSTSPSPGVCGQDFGRAGQRDAPTLFRMQNDAKPWKT